MEGKNNDETNIIEAKKRPRPEPGAYTIFRLPQNNEEKDLWRRLIVVLESAYFTVILDLSKL